MKRSLLASLTLLLVVQAAMAQDVARRDVLSYASEKRYWVVQVVPPGSRSIKNSQSEIRMRDSTGTTVWKRVSVVGGRAIDLAHREGDLAVLLDDQSWLLVWPGGSSTGPPLPGAAVMRALGSDEQSLWSLGVHAAPSTQPTADVEARVIAPGTLQTFLFTGGGWQPRAVVPPQLTNEKSVSFAIFDGLPMIVWKSGDRELQFVRLTREGAWTPAETMQTGFAIADFRLLPRAPTPTLWVAGAAGGGELRTRRESWSGPIPLKGSDFPGTAAHRTAEYFAGNVRLLALSDGRLREQPFGLDGSPSGKPLDLGRTPPTEQQPVSVLSLVLMAIIALVLSTAIFRVEVEEGEASSRPTLALATHSRRLIAGLIDLSPFVATMLLQVPWFDGDAASTAFQDQRTLIYLMSSWIVYMLHTTVLELFTGKTIGKMICRLRVANVDGSAPGKMAVIIRNLVRPIDVMPGLPLAMLILFSPMRQRLGDVLAGTTVVRDSPTGAPDSDDAGKHDQADPPAIDPP